MFLFYDGPSPPKGVFDMFLNIGPISNNCKTRSYYDLLSYNNFAVIKGSVYTITTETIPLPNAANGEEVMKAVYDNWKKTAKSIQIVPGVIASIAFQPVPKIMARKAKERGGDLIDLDDDIDRIILEFNSEFCSERHKAKETADEVTVSYIMNQIAADKIDQATQQLYQGTRDVVTGFQQSGKLPQGYLPLFMNDCYFRQDYFARLRTADFARSVRDQYDPEGFFRDRTKGWKM